MLQVPSFAFGFGLCFIVHSCTFCPFSASASAIMKWTDGIEAKLLELWHDSEARSQKTMRSKKDQRRWVFEKLTSFASSRSPPIDTSTLTNLRRKGKSLVEKHVRPLLKGVPKGTGSEAVDEGVLPDPHVSLDWEELSKAAKWPNFRLYFDLFGNHPTWGIWPVKDTAAISDDDEEDAEQRGKSATPPPPPPLSPPAAASPPGRSYSQAP